VRAFNPWPVAETRWQGRQLRIWAAEPVACGGAAEPGTIIEATRSGLVVATGEGCLALLQLQLPGGKPMNYKDLINAQELSGARLGA
jgi:methionyl-tRNA formyltransferase